MRRSCLYLLFLICGCVRSAAQVFAPIPRFQTIGVNEGLSQSSVYALYQDRKGFLWIATGDGLNRYDGSRIKRYFVPTAAGMPPASLLRGNLCEDDSGNIWFVNEHGVHHWNARQDQILTSMAFSRSWHFPEYYATHLTGNTLWALNSQQGMLQYNIRTGRYRLFPLPDSLRKEEGSYSDLRTVQHGVVCFKRIQQGSIILFDANSEQYRRALPPSSYHLIYSGKGRHYLLAPSGFLVYDSSSRQSSYHRLPGIERGIGARYLVEDRWGRAWIGSHQTGLFCYDPATKQITSYRHSNLKLASLPIDIVPTVFIDRADNLWVGTDGGGICRLDLKPPRFHIFPLNEGDYPVLKDYFVKCFYEDREGNIWFGTHNNGLCILNKQTGALRNIQQYLGDRDSTKPLRIVGAIAEDQDRNIWLAHGLGFTLYDPVNNRFQDLPLQPMPQLAPWALYVNGLCSLRNGAMLAATTSGAVLFQKKNGQWQGRSFIYNPQLGHLATSVAETPDGGIWMACRGKGLLRLALQADSLQVTGQYFEGLSIRGLHPDEQNLEVLWIATSNGFAKLHIPTGSYRFWGIKEGMSNTYVYGVLEDTRHQFWLSTNGGLLHFDPVSARFTSYTYADGLQSNEFNSGAYYKGRDGTLYFGGIRGFNWFRPEQMQPSNTCAPGVAITDLTVNGQAYTAAWQGGKMMLPYTQNNIGFRIAVLDYSRPEANTIAYRLDGWDASWTETRNHDIRYSNLPPGDYTLRVKGRNAVGVWSHEETLIFRITAPFWRSGWFYGLSLVALVSLITGCILFIIRRKLAAQQRIIAQQQLLMSERSRISKDMHDEIGSGLTRIAMMSESLKQGKEFYTEEMKKIAQDSRALVQSMGEIIWALNPTQDTLESLLAYLREHLYHFLEPFDVEYTIAFPRDVPQVVLSNVQRRNIYLTAKEALNNALKHSRSKHIRISVVVDKGRFIFTLQDDGGGFCEKDIRQGANGLINMQKRIEEIGGHFYRNSIYQQGTEIRFWVPIGEEAKKKQREKLA